MTRMVWSRAACRTPGVDRAWFFPTRTRAGAAGARRECFEMALAQREQFGIWAGVSFGKTASRYRERRSA